jgi:hypothetical protein
MSLSISKHCSDTAGAGHVLQKSGFQAVCTKIS